MSLWPLARPLIPRPVARPQGGGTRRTDDEAVFGAVVHVLASGSAWREVPKVFGTSWQTTHRRFTQWCNADLWRRLVDAAAEAESRAPEREQAAGDLTGWARTLAEAADERLREARGDTSGRRAPAPRPYIKRQFSGGFVEQLFGPRRWRTSHGGPPSRETTFEEFE
ncbi:transposase [Saccharothrix sp. NRRL B-16314]|uniref:transposase n=1 Tax=Saccharothrix sp. NRRL B-16314 TaxID=1463825 RepID=UPI0007C56331|nr:transposase [Saccharothrix sp. NRRL B-16314]